MIVYSRYTRELANALIVDSETRAVELKTMLRRIFSLTILLGSLLLAGLPAIACADCVPTHECCPKGAPASCKMDGAAPVSSDFVQLGCNAGVAGSIASVSDDAANDFHSHLKRIDVPDLQTGPSISRAARVESYRSIVKSSPSTFGPSSTLLYLSTGRLRL